MVSGFVSFAMGMGVFLGEEREVTITSIYAGNYGIDSVDMGAFRQRCTRLRG
jgi:hypothetical protein